MNKCPECGSYSINPNQQGRDSSCPDLCDICYWKVKLADAQERIAELKALLIQHCTLPEITDDIYHDYKDTGLFEEDDEYGSVYCGTVRWSQAAHDFVAMLSDMRDEINAKSPCE
jgi:hypothetical protein